MRTIRRLTTVVAALLIAANFAAAQSFKMCLSGGPMDGIYYFDIRSTPEGTVFKRYAWNNHVAGMMLVDTNTYAPLHPPPGMTLDMASWPETTWNEGVAFGATMQTRGAWRPQPIVTATWTRFVPAATGVSEDFIRFYQQNSDGSVSQLPLMQSSCLESPYTDHGAFDPNRERRVCLTSGSMSYDLRTSPSAGTTFRRYENGVLVDTNTYAALQGPNAGTLSPWNDGVAFAATMQSRHAWVNVEPTSTASWAVTLGPYTLPYGDDVMRFSTTVNGSPTELVFRTSQCTN